LIARLIAKDLSSVLSNGHHLSLTDFSTMLSLSLAIYDWNYQHDGEIMLVSFSGIFDEGNMVGIPIN
jgi:hypothetical protein